MLTITLYRVFGYDVTSMVLRVSIGERNSDALDTSRLVQRSLPVKLQYFDDHDHSAIARVGTP